jgi:hypothetical protein
VDVAVDEPWQHGGVAKVDDFGVRGRALRDRFDALAAHDDVRVRNAAAADVEQAPRVQGDGLRRGGSRGRRHQKDRENV